jgi:hypothetical protein
MTQTKSATAALEVTQTGIPVPAAPACKTIDLFTDRKVFAWRDPNLDTWVSQSLPPAPQCTTTVYRLTKDGVTFSDMAKALLRETTDDPAIFAKLLVQRGKTFSPKQVEDLVTRFERGEKTIGLRDDGCANFFFVYDGTSVFVLRADRRSTRWDVGVARLDDAYEWLAPNRLVARN